MATQSARRPSPRSSRPLRRACTRLLRIVLRLSASCLVLLLFIGVLLINALTAAPPADTFPPTSGAVSLIPSGKVFRPNSRGIASLSPVCFAGPTRSTLVLISGGRISTPDVPDDVERAAEKSELIQDILGVYAGEEDVRALPRGRNPEIVKDDNEPQWRTAAWLTWNDVDWVDDDYVNVIIPPYPYLYNIYHYARAWLFALQVTIWSDPAYGNFGYPAVFHSQQKFRFAELYPPKEPWSLAFREMIKSHLSADKFTEVPHLTDDANNDAVLCFRNAILLGVEATVDAVHFLNDSTIFTEDDFITDSHMPHLPRAALAFRTMLNPSESQELPTAVDIRDASTVPWGAPPFSMAYVARGGTKRRFRKGKERLFQKLLFNLAKEKGIPCTRIAFDNKPFSEQMELVRGHGLIVGVHGANLVNSMFMDPGSALFEIFPHNYKRSYYVGGGNTGLRYSYWETLNASREYQCGKRCPLKYRDQPIALNDDDLRGIRTKIASAIEYLRSISKRGTVDWVPDETASGGYLKLANSVRGQ